MGLDGAQWGGMYRVPSRPCRAGFHGAECMWIADQMAGYAILAYDLGMPAAVLYYG